MSEKSLTVVKDDETLKLLADVLQPWSRRLNQEPLSSEVFEHREKQKDHSGKWVDKLIALYIPVSHIQMKLDEIFLGLWSTKNYKTHLVANENVGSIELHVFHPVAQTWLIRTGSAAVPIQQQKGAGITEIEKKYKNAMVKNAPTLKEMCIINAAKSLGKTFGRDLNRADALTDIYQPEIDLEADITESYLSKIKQCKNQKDIENVMNEAQKSMTAEKYQELRKTAIELFRSKGAK